MDFDVIPAIDVLGGRCVRLAQGRYDAATTYAEHPADAARAFAARPIRRLHVVDLDGAKSGEATNRAAIERILEAVGEVPVQVGGGIRSLEAAEAWLSLGVDRVVFGTVAAREPERVLDVAARHPGRVAVGIDAREGRVAVEGWTESSGLEASALAQRFEGAGVAAIVYTDILRDGMQTGPNLEATAELAREVSIPVIISGGVGTLAHVREAAQLAASVAGGSIAGLIVGRALYTGAVDLGEALELAACC